MIHYRLQPEVKEKLGKVGSANIANVLLARGYKNVMMLGLSPISEEQPQMVGPAYTLRFIPAREDIDNLETYQRDDNLHRRAIEECPQDGVLVIDAFGSLAASSMGDMMAARLKYRKVKGVVTDGGYRDSSDIAATGLPCYQVRNAPPATPIAMHPVALNEPIGCAGVAVYPGDVLVGDRDGVVVIPQDLVDEVAEEAFAIMEYEEYAALRISQGHAIFGLFPATPESRNEYRQWLAAGRPETEMK